jgi:hypothetical protein
MWGGTMVQKTGSKPERFAVMAAMWHCVTPLSLLAARINEIEVFVTSCPLPDGDPAY